MLDGEADCTPGLSYMEDCNYCTCSPDGQNAACTQMACPPKDSLEENAGITQSLYKAWSDLNLFSDT
jgi:hypothetical protein